VAAVSREDLGNNTTQTHMTEAIEKLRAAVKKIKDATGETFIFAGIEIKFNDAVEFYVYRNNYHRSADLESATDAALAFDANAWKRAEIEVLKAKIAKLESEAQ
jgi:hypothetical protein